MFIRVRGRDGRVCDVADRDRSKSCSQCLSENVELPISSYIFIAVAVAVRPRKHIHTVLTRALTAFTDSHTHTHIVQSMGLV